MISVRRTRHPSPLSLMKVLSITYQGARGPAIRSIAAYGVSAERAFRILQRFAPGADCIIPFE